MHLHCAIALTPEKKCLGAVSIKQWYREELQKLTQKERTKKNQITPLEDKESFRWLENYRKANEYAVALPNTMIVSMADREGDIYDIYEEANQIFDREKSKAYYLIRAQYDRKVCSEQGKKTRQKIKSDLKSENPLGQIVVNISETTTRKSREAHLTVYSKVLYIGLPDRRKKDKNYNPPSVTAILCTENNPPSRLKPVEWLLITNISVSTFEEACEKIQWYTCRWQIEIFF